MKKQVKKRGKTFSNKHYIAVSTTFVNHAKEKILKVFSSQEYKILKI